MLRTISAALLAVSVLAAPAFAGAPGTARAGHVQAPAIKMLTSNPKVMNAYAYMGRRHHHHFRYHRHHRHHRYHW